MKNTLPNVHMVDIKGIKFDQTESKLEKALLNGVFITLALFTAFVFNNWLGV